MTVAELEHFRELLLQQEHSVSEWLTTADSVRGADMAKVRSLLDEIRDALGRIVDKSFGACTHCDGEVELHRLGIQPTSQICLDCISDEEKATLENDLFMASKIHRALLPQGAPHIEGLEVAYQSIPSTGVGGDYIDFMRPDNRQSTLLAIGDAMGKGMAAALVMSNVQGVLRVLAADFDSLAPLMQSLNQWICRNIPIAKFVSMTCLLVEAAHDGHSQITYVNAGHCPPLLVRANGTIEPLAATGTVLGVHEDLDYESETVSLARGDLLVLYTDGLIEAENGRGEMFEDRRLMESLARHQAASAESIVSAIEETVRSFCAGRSFGDDYTVMVLRKM